MSILVTGSIAYDTIMVFPDRFRNHLLADQLHILNVCFLTPQMRREFGGTAGNIGYNLKLLGENPLVMATVGEDIQPYLERFDELGIPTRLLTRVPGEFTAQGFITTDLDDNQITAFHPGAMNHSHKNHVTRELSARLAIIAPDGKEGMLQHARECAAAAVPFLFDPGQGLPMFSGEEIGEFLRLADYVAVNDYEGKMLEEKRGRKLEALAREGLADLRRRQALRSTVRSRRSRDRSDRLRRRLPRGPALWHCARLGLGQHGQARRRHGRGQDRASRGSEPHRHPGRNRAPVPRRLRLFTLAGMRPGFSPRTLRASRAAGFSPAR